jgi:hypothetical protein
MIHLGHSVTQVKHLLTLASMLTFKWEWQNDTFESFKTFVEDACLDHPDEQFVRTLQATQQNSFCNTGFRASQELNLSANLFQQQPTKQRPKQCLTSIWIGSTAGLFPTQRELRLADSLPDRVQSKRERLSMLMFPSGILCCTANAEGAEFEDLFLTSPWRNC